MVFSEIYYNVWLALQEFEQSLLIDGYDDN